MWLRLPFTPCRASGVYGAPAAAPAATATATATAAAAAGCCLYGEEEEEERELSDSIAGELAWNVLLWNLLAPEWSLVSV